MRTKWKLVGLAFLALVVVFYLIVPLFTIQVTIKMPPGTTDAVPQDINRIATWIVVGLVLTFALAALGAIAWVVRHVLLRQQRPNG
ncbi:hypothetical protein [Caulobacter soli]|uniref:hypothetical protein n=1 Tax=Caulobacter soli TaxID=2708539 RepID=UPI0013EA9114|nr:hypothetical protein [Caulobacter soli]